MRREHCQLSVCRGSYRRVRSLLVAVLKARALRLACAIFAAGMPAGTYAADAAPNEYQLKAAYIFNFASFTEWPAEIGDRITLCIYGADPFGAAIDAFQEMNIDGRSFQVRRIASVDELASCQVVFVANTAIENLPRVLDGTHRKPVLNITDTPAAALGGAGINMVMEEGKIGFEVNLAALRNNGLDISFQLLRLARKVYQ